MLCEKTWAAESSPVVVVVVVFSLSLVTVTFHKTWNILNLDVI